MKNPCAPVPPGATPGPFRLIFSKPFRKSFIIFICVLLGNLGYYFLRVHWPVAAPRLKTEGVINNELYSSILSATYVANTLGKPIGGIIIDYTNKPKWSFVFFLVLTAAVAVVSTFVPYFAGVIIFWSLSRFFTSVGRMSVIKIMSSWWPKSVMGTVMGIVTVSCSVGESMARVSLSQSLNLLSWQQMMYVAATIGCLCILPTVFFVRDGLQGGFETQVDPELESETCDSRDEQVEIEVGINPPAPAYSEKPMGMKRISDHIKPVDIKGKRVSMMSGVSGGEPPKRSFLRDFVGLLKKPRFVILCLVCMMTNLIREIVGHHSIMFMKDVLERPDSEIGSISAIFSIFSATSSFFGGRIMDAVPRRRRGFVNSVYCAGIVVFVSAIYWFLNTDLTNVPLTQQVIVCVSLMTTAEFFLGPPVSYVDGLFVIDMVEHRQVAFASGAIGCIGYIGPFCMNFLMGRWEQNQEWTKVWLLCLIAAIATFVLSLFYWFFDVRVLNRRRSCQL